MSRTRVVLLTLAIVGILLLAVSAVGGSGSSGPCIVLANGGNTLCGATAASWCRATDPARQDAAQAGINVPGGGLCKQIEGQYPQ